VLSDAGLQDKLPRLTLTDDLTLSFPCPAGYFNVVHANSVFTHCPVEIIRPMPGERGPGNGSRRVLRFHLLCEVMTRTIRCTGRLLLPPGNPARDG